MRPRIILRTALLCVAASVWVSILEVGVAVAASCKAAGYPIGSGDGDYQHDRWVKGAEAGDLKFKFEGFVSMFDGADNDDNDASKPDVLFQPEWVAQEVQRYLEGGIFVYAKGLDRPSNWYEFRRFSGLPTGDGITTFDLDNSYDGEGLIWNRGHMATRNLVNRINAEAGCNSHNFANAVPQYWSLNQGEWLALENYTGALANKYGTAWQISGPVFIPGADIEFIGQDGEVRIPIPHALFKVIVFNVEEEIYVRAFLFHQPEYERVKEIIAATGTKQPYMGFHLCPKTKQEDFDFSGYVSSLSEIEGMTGIEFFPDATTAEKVALNEYSSRKIWAVEPQFFERPCGTEAQD
jgi:endonuclease G, mitochondrial